MKSFLLILLQLFCFQAFSQTLAELKSKQVTLPTGWKLSPVGTSIPLGDLPLNICIAPNQKIAAVTNNGQSKQSIQLIDLKNQQVLHTQEIGKAWLGLAWGNDSEILYASGGNDNWVIRYSVERNRLVTKDTLFIGKPWPEKISIAGMTLDDSRNRLYVVTKDNNSLYVIDTSTKKIIQQLQLPAEAYACILAPNKKILYISCWGCDKILAVDTQLLNITNQIQVGDNPNDIAISKNGKFLYVANANDNSVSVIDTRLKKEIEVLNTALYPNAPSGSTTNSVALSADQKTLFIANADNNCLSVFDVSNPGSSKSKGFIPVGWYPTVIRTLGNTLLVANGKGFSSFPNPKGPSPIKKKQKVNYQQGDTKKEEEVQYIG
ncbi:MAG: beta-propeller fold lactonase family protein, partial [Cytophagales bacterium]